MLHFVQHDSNRESLKCKLIYHSLIFSEDISVYSYHVQSSHDICRAQKYSINCAPSLKAKKDSSDFSFSYNRKIYFMVSKIYFYVFVPRSGSSKHFLCRNLN